MKGNKNSLSLLLVDKSIMIYNGFGCCCSNILSFLTALK